MFYLLREKLKANSASQFLHPKLPSFTGLRVPLNRHILKGKFQLLLSSYNLNTLSAHAITSMFRNLPLDNKWLSSAKNLDACKPLCPLR